MYLYNNRIKFILSIITLCIPLTLLYIFYIGIECKCWYNIRWLDGIIEKGCICSRSVVANKLMLLPDIIHN